MSYPRRAVLAATSAVVALGLMACSGGGASDEVGAAEAAPSGNAAASSVINLYAYAVPKVGFDQQLLWVVVGLLCFGLVMVYSASIALPDNPRFGKITPMHFLVRHMVGLVLATGAVYCVSWGAISILSARVDARRALLRRDPLGMG